MTQRDLDRICRWLVRYRLSRMREFMLALGMEP